MITRVSNPPPILDYASPPRKPRQRLLDRLLDFIFGNSIVRFLFVRPVRASEVALIGWPMMCGVHFAIEINSYFLKSPYDLLSLRIAESLFNPAIAIVSLGAIIVLAIKSRWRTAMIVILVNVGFTYGSGTLRLLDSPYTPHALWWLDYIPHWKSF